MQKLVFRKKVSKGSRFNQIYIPKCLENRISVGDEVEVRLVKKHIGLYYSRGLGKLSAFKENLIRDIFSFLESFDKILNIFVVGSFLSMKIDYNDIDIVIITEEREDGIEEQVYGKLIDKFNLKFHILNIGRKKLEYLLKACPLTRAMFSLYVSNKDVNLEKKKIIDKNHLSFLLMMPEDLLEIRLSSRVFFDNLRRLIVIEMFLDDKSLELEDVSSELSDLIGKRLYQRMKDNLEVEERVVGDMRAVIKAKLIRIRKMI
ncbi:hypothetical protein KY358_01425 [Candidatus Woesearchaeota archaeon]|nr:hypothetical protein [Candidatus Woesearchaeota archaeon]